jgi:hypothetical protein
MPVKYCPGAANLTGTPTLKVKKCPACGVDVELFSTDIQVPCTACGFIVYNDIQSCIRWCKFAKECIGEELYEQLTQKQED